MDYRRILYCLCAISLFVSCKSNIETAGDDKLFSLLPATQTGIQFENKIVDTDTLNILDYLYYYNGGGVAIGDINNDGLPDIATLDMQPEFNKRKKEMFSFLSYDF